MHGRIDSEVPIKVIAFEMSDSEHQTSERATLKHEAHEWVLRLTSGEATQADAEALNRWRRTTNLLWDKLRPAAESARRGSQLAAREPGRLGRRAFLGGAIAASAVGLAYVGVRPPLDLWPSLAEMASDYRTGIGQQQQITLENNVSVTLNTRTSIALL